MPEIKITNQEQKTAFDAVYKIIKSGIITSVGEIPIAADEGVISHGNMSYVFINELARGEGGERKEDFTITDTGATWFDALRGEGADTSAASAWEVFLGNFSSEYHKSFFLTAYPMRHRQSGGGMSENLGKSVISFLNKVYPHIGGLSVAGSKGHVGEEDVYVLTLRMQIGTTMGEKVPMIGKLLISKPSDIRLFRASDLTAVSADDARLMVSEFETYRDNQKPSDLGLLSAGSKHATVTVLAEISKKLSSMISSNAVSPLSDYVFFEKTSEEKLGAMLDKLAVGERNLECGQIEVLGISNIRWETTSLDVMDSRGNKLFRVKGGTDNKVSVRCLGCDGEDLIINNIVRFTLDDGSHLELTLDFTSPDFGVSEEDLKLLVSSDEFAGHYIPRSDVICNHGTRAKKCSPYKCRAHLMTLPEGVTVCRACKYPEIVYTGTDGVQHYTPRAVFASDIMDFIPKDSALVCRGGCGRYIKKRGDANICPLCKEVANINKGVDSAKARYKKYSSLMPLESRIGAMGSVKLCYEDSELIFFVIASEESGALIPKKKYVFHKMWADTKTVKAPVKLKM